MRPAARPASRVRSPPRPWRATRVRTHNPFYAGTGVSPTRSPPATIGVTAMDERPVERETVVVDSDSRGGGGGAIVAIIVILVLAVMAFLVFGGYFGRTDK